MEFSVAGGMLMPCTSAGKLFRICGQTTGKARLATADSQTETLPDDRQVSDSDAPERGPSLRGNATQVHARLYQVEDLKLSRSGMRLTGHA